MMMAILAGISGIKGILMIGTLLGAVGGLVYTCHKRDQKLVKEGYDKAIAKVEAARKADRARKDKKIKDIREDFAKKKERLDKAETPEEQLERLKDIAE